MWIELTIKPSEKKIKELTDHLRAIGDMDTEVQTSATVWFNLSNVCAVGFPDTGGAAISMVDGKNLATTDEESVKKLKDALNSQ